MAFPFHGIRCKKGCSKLEFSEIAKSEQHEPFGVKSGSYIKFLTFAFGNHVQGGEVLGYSDVGEESSELGGGL